MARLRVEVLEAHPARAERVALELDDGATVRTALQAAGKRGATAAGIYGRRVSLDAPLVDGDRVEVYRPLRADPREARRRRALKRAR